MNVPFIPSTQKGAYVNVVAWVIALFVLGAVITGGLWVWRYFTAPVAGKVAARQQIQSGSFRIAAYDSFFNTCAAVQSDDARLDAQATELSTATGDDIARIQANIAGITADRAEAINQYNADASKSYTVGQFRASKLPYQLSTDPHVKGATITCAA